MKPEAWTMSMPKLETFYSGNLGPQFAFYGRARLGVGVQDLTEQLGDYFGTSQGALVTAVDDNTPAKEAGLKAGDVITKINGEAVRDSARPAPQAHTTPRARRRSPSCAIARN